MPLHSNRPCNVKSAVRQLVSCTVTGGEPFALSSCSIWSFDQKKLGHNRGRMVQNWANPAKSCRTTPLSLLNVADERLEVVRTTAPFAPCQQQNGPRRRRDSKCPQALAGPVLASSRRNRKCNNAAALPRGGVPSLLDAQEAVGPSGVARRL